MGMPPYLLPNPVRRLLYTVLRLEGCTIASKFQPLDLANRCRVYFFFSSNSDKPFITYYDRPQYLSDAEIHKEATVNSGKMLKLFGLNELNRIFIARTERQVSRVEAML